MSKKFIYLEHPADIKIKSFGKDLVELFINSAFGMMDFLYGKIDFKNIFATQNDIVNVTAEDLESLLVNWLAELLYLSAINKCFYFNYKIEKIFIESNNLQIIAKVSGIKAKAKDDIKAVTYHELTIQKTQEGYFATVVYDI